MKSARIKLLLLVGLVFVLGGGYFLSLRYSAARDGKAKAASTAKAEPGSESLLSLKMDEVKEIQIRNEHATYRFVVEEKKKKNTSDAAGGPASSGAAATSSVSDPAEATRSEAATSLTSHEAKEKGTTDAAETHRSSASAAKETDHARHESSKKEDVYFEAELKEPQMENLSQAKVKSIFDSLLAVSVVQAVPESAKAADYGFDPATAKATYVLRDGKQFDLELGAQVPGSSSQYYARRSDQKRIFIIRSAASALKTEPTELLDADIVQLDSSRLKSLTLERRQNQEEERLEAKAHQEKREQAQAGKTGEKGQNDTITLWKIEKPVEHAADSDRMNTLAAEITGLTAERFVKYPAKESDLSQYGLDHPNYRIEISDQTGASTELKIGNETGDGSYYVWSSRLPAVFTIGNGKLKYLGANFLTLIDRFALLVNIDELSGLDFSMKDEGDAHFDISVPAAEDGKKLSRDETEKNSHFWLNGRDLNIKDAEGKNAFKSFYRSLIGIMAEGFDPNAEVKGEATLRLTYTYKKDGRTARVELYPRTEDTYYIVLNGKYSGLYTNASYLEADKDSENLGVRPALKKLFAFLSVKNFSEIKPQGTEGNKESSKENAGDGTSADVSGSSVASDGETKTSSSVAKGRAEE